MIFLISVKIFFARILDVSLGTVRMYSTVKGDKLKAVLIAFFEVLIWFIIAREALTIEINSIFIPISYSAGYAVGTFIGMLLNEKVINGIVTVQLICEKDDSKITNKLRSEGYALSVVNLEDPLDDINKKMLIIQIRKQQVKHLVNIINKLEKKYFFTIHETKYLQNGILK